MKTIPLLANYITIPLAFAVVFSMLAGCQKEQNSSSNGASTVGATSTSKDQSSEAVATGTDTSNASADQKSKTELKPQDVETEIADLLHKATSLAEQGRFDEARKHTDKALLLSPNDFRVRFLTARLIAVKGDLRAAIDMIESIDSQDKELRVAVLGQSAEWHLAIGKATAAESRLEQLVELMPENARANHLLYRICNAKGKRFDSAAYVRKYVELGSFQLSDLAMLCNIENAFADEQIYEVMQQEPSEKTHVLVYEARRDLITFKWESARPRLEEALRLDPSNLEAWIWLGYVEASLDRWNELERWYAQRPKGFDQHPQFWIVLGMWLEHQERYEEAVLAYKRTLEIDPRSPTATSRIAKVLIDLDKTEIAESFRQRALAITRSNALVRDALANLNAEACSRVSTEYKKLGDAFLADSWSKVAKFIDKTPAPSKGEGSEIALAIDQSETSRMEVGTQVLPISPLLAKLESLELKPLMLEGFAKGSGESQMADGGDAKHISFEDVTEEVGLAQAEYDWGRMPEEKGVYVYRSLGGGVGVLDYDLNGFPDLYFSRAGAKPSAADQNKTKQLFRNRDGQFEEVPTTHCTLIDRGYGQGIACGDFDQDGMPDVLVANIGSCSLYRNNGDGTFSWIYSAPLNKSNKWVTACALADINRDSLPDIVAATYFEDSDYEQRICSRAGTESYNCAPAIFPGCHDLFILNSGDGNWSESPSEFLTGEIDKGRTLGVVVGDFDAKGGNDVYFSNDTTANHYFVNRAEKDKVVLNQSSGVAGVAVNANGRPQGSMGIAVSDIDHNGLDDILVTNAQGEYNILYSQRRANLFVDASRTWNLLQDSLDMVAFGCVFADVDNDSWEDLFVVNGNLDDYTPVGEGYKLLPQFYYNNGERMQLIASPRFGSFFKQPTLGRGLATIDFDVDHKTDFVATHCDRNASLVRNTTDTKSHFVELELVGVTCDRDAIGARAKIEYGGKVCSQGLYAGEGYYSSCERLMRFGVGDTDAIERLTLIWPDGSEQVIEDLAIDKRHLIVQNKSPFVR